MSRFVRARTAASETPRSAAIWVNGRRPSAWRCSMIRLSSRRRRRRPVAARVRGRARVHGSAHEGWSTRRGFAGRCRRGRDRRGRAGAGRAATGRVVDVRTLSGPSSGSSASTEPASGLRAGRRPGVGGRWRSIGPHSTRMFRPMNRDRRLALAGLACRSFHCMALGEGFAVELYWLIASGQPSYVAHGSA